MIAPKSQKLHLQSGFTPISLFLCGSILLAGCGSESTSSAPAYIKSALPRPESVYVYRFDMNPELVQPDQSLTESLKASTEGQSNQTRRVSIANEVQTSAAKEIVSELRSSGIDAVLADYPPPAGKNTLLVKGRFVKIDAGSRTRRVVIGLGAGKSQVSASVQIWYQSASGKSMLIQSLDTSEDSGHKPGMAETLGVGALTSTVIGSAAAGGAVHAASETFHAAPVDDAKRLGEDIAKRVTRIDSADGWQSTSTDH